MEARVAWIQVELYQQGFKDMSSVGEELRRERELRGISLEEIADETKIALRFLQAIDSNQLEIIPGEFYRRSSLKAYAHYLGLDVDRIVATYQFRNAAESSTPALLLEGGSTAGRIMSRRAVKWAAVVLAVVGASGAAVAVWPGAERQDVPVSASVERTSSRELRTDEHAGGVPSEAVRRDRVEVGPVVREVLEEESAEGLPLRLRFRVDDSCWLEIRADDSLVAQGLMHRGFEKEIQAAEEIRLWLGNAGGISVWINDRPAKPFGQPGQVRKDLRITVGNFVEFLAPEEEADVAEVPTEVR
jgi:transcriptional regulator with XRE-family HTH domain